ncbi:EAL domain-containing protein [Burkholderia pseudomallei]|uniref:EAL domain-containing protein n=1 Tax=Burkholderia pseudomallei TaxID=28450 RepID=UPI00201B19FE|nr:EAL domain-containing protein [Burkholderia pseudomallei]MCL4666352.1 EAL domain-containing protein [Burkholderia pseudomallei]
MEQFPTSSTNPESARPNAQIRIMVELQNHSHLCAAYGKRFGVEAMRKLGWRAYRWGGSGMILTAIGDNRFIVALPARDSSPRTAERPVAESCLLALSGTPISHGGVHALAVVDVHTIDAESGQGSNRTREPADQVGPVPPAQHTAGWRNQYMSDVHAAVAFRQSLRSNLSYLSFQPIVRRNSAPAVLYEQALLSIVGDDDQSGEHPASIVAALERLGLARLFDYRVVHAVVARLLRTSDARLGCRISPRSAMLDVWWASLVDWLASHPCVARRFTVEIPCNTPVTRRAAALAFVRKLQTLGCSVAVTDFDTGGCDLEFALLARPQVVKISAGALRALPAGNSLAERLARLVRPCSSFDPQIVVEGVNDPHDLNVLEAVDAAWVQGLLQSAAVNGSRAEPLVVWQDQ